MPFVDPEKHRECCRRWYERNREKACAKNRERYAQTPEKNRAKYERERERVIERSRRWAAANPGRVHDGRLRRNFGITVADYEAMLESQGGRCALFAVCGSTEPGAGRKRWHVDHDHETGKVRALLCNGCNLGIGHFQDSPELLLKAAQYLASQVPAQEAARALI